MGLDIIVGLRFPPRRMDNGIGNGSLEAFEMQGRKATVGPWTSQGNMKMISTRFGWIIGIGPGDPVTVPRSLSFEGARIVGMIDCGGRHFLP